MTKKAEIQGDFYGYSVIENGKTMFEAIGRAIFINAIQREIETGDVFFRVSFHYSGYEVLETLPRQSFNRSGLMKLQAKGADVFENSFPCLIDVLKQQEATINIENIHQGLGWYPVPSKKYKNKIVKVFRSNYINYLNSTYSGNFDIEPIGSQEKWLEMIQEHVIGTNMELPLILGFSAAVNGYLANALDVKNLFVHFYGDSSTGKSTALQLAVSVAGNPTPSEKSLFMSWNATSNALIRLLADNNGYPVAIDETSMSSEEEFTSLIYRLSSGQDKRRMNKDLSLDKTPTFCTTLLSSGEHSLLAKSKKNTGLRARLIEFGNLELTTSAEQAEAIKAVTIDNYGHAIAPFATFVKRYKKEQLMQKLNFFRKKYLKKSSIQDSLSNRVSSKYAIILLTAKLVNECFNLNIDLEYILDLLTENEKSSQSRDIGVQAYEYLKEYVNINANLFLFDDNLDNAYYGKTIGKIEELSTPYINKQGEKFHHELTFIKSECEKALNLGGFEDVSIIMKKFKAMNLLNYEKDRNTRKRKLFNEGQVLPCYVIWME